MIRSLTMATTALALTALLGPASATPAPAPAPAQRGVSVVIQKDKVDDVARGRGWAGASQATRRAADLRKVTVGDSPRGAKYFRFAWKTQVLQKRQKDVARTYSTFASTPETETPVEVRLVQVNKSGLEALLFVDGNTSGCLYSKGAPPIGFGTKSRIVTLDIRRACLKSATDGAIGLVMSDAIVTIERERTVRDRVIGTDTVVFKFNPQKNF